MTKYHSSSFFRILSVFLASIVVSSALFYLLARTDNKYASPASQPIGGVLILTEEELAARPLRFLIQQWEFYPGKLFTPSDFASGTPSAYRQFVSIGQYGGFEAGNAARSPHGSATYRLTFNLPSPMRTYALELPEVYSACRLYVNGVQLLSLGNLDPEQYESKLQSRLVTFEGEGQVQLLLAVSDYAGIYSGLIYPPSFGTVEAVEQMRNIRLVLRTTVLVLALAAVVLSFFLGFGAERQRQVLLTLLCFCAMSYTCVPLLRMLFALPLQPWAAVEVLCLHAALLLVLLLQAGICGLGPRIRIALAVPCGAICLLAVLESACAQQLSLNALLACSLISGYYKYAVAACLLCIAALGFARNSISSPALLAGSTCYATALAWDRFYPAFEPVYGGWFPEIACAVMICILVLTLWEDFANAYRFRQSFAEEQRQTRQQLAIQKEHYRQLSGQVERVREASHDFRQHIRTLQGLAEAEDLTAVREYLDRLEVRTDSLQVHVHTNHPVVDAILRFYESEAVRVGVDFQISLQLPPVLDFPDDELCILLGNLLENASEACQRQTDDSRFINLRANVRNKRLGIIIENSFSDELHRQSNFFLSQKHAGAGIGVRSVKAVVKRHGGLCSFEPQGQRFRVSVLIPLA